MKIKRYNHYLYLLFWYGVLAAGCRNNQKSADWTVYLGDKSSTHYSHLKQIDTNNVSKLQVAWVFNTGDADKKSGSQIQCNPLIIDGVLYGTSPRLKLFALDAATGKQIWMFDPFADTTIKVRVNVNRGVAYWTDKKEKRIFYAVGEYLYAVNATTGELFASFGDNGKENLGDNLGRDVKKLYVTSTSPGIVFKDILIMGTRVAETNPAAPGDVRAYDVHTGKIKWIFHTIPVRGNREWRHGKMRTHGNIPAVLITGQG